MTSFLCICGPDCIRKHELTQSEAPPNSRRVLSQATVLRLCLLLSFRCSHRRRFTSLSVQSVVAECVRQHGYRTGDGFWTSTLAIATTTDHNNAYNNNMTATKSLCSEARMWRRIVTAHRILQQVVVIIHVLLRQKNVTLVSILSVQSSLTL